MKKIKIKSCVECTSILGGKENLPIDCPRKNPNYLWGDDLNKINSDCPLEDYQTDDFKNAVSDAYHNIRNELMEHSAVIDEYLEELVGE